MTNQQRRPPVPQQNRTPAPKVAPPPKAQVPAKLEPKKPSGIVVLESLADAYPILSPVNAKDVIEAITENLGGGGVNINDLDRVRIPTGGSTSWQIKDLEGERDEKEITGIIVGFKDVRAYWPDAYTGGKTPPACTSDDCVTGHGAPGGDCATCPWAAFGSHEDGRRQACKQQRLIFLVQPGSMLPTVIAAPPTSLKPLRQYFLAMAGRGIAYKTALTTLTLEKTQNEGTPAFSQIRTRLDGKLDPGDANLVREYAKSLELLLAKPGVAATMGARMAAEETGEGAADDGWGMDGDQGTDNPLGGGDGGEDEKGDEQAG